MSEIQTYKNWKAVTEADFVSLFIKTWFAYISTLRVMFPEAQNTRGDGNICMPTISSTSKKAERSL